MTTKDLLWLPSIEVEPAPTAPAGLGGRCGPERLAILRCSAMMAWKRGVDQDLVEGSMGAAHPALARAPEDAGPTMSCRVEDLVTNAELFLRATGSHLSG